MTIEVRQLVIKSTVVKDEPAEMRENTLTEADFRAIKAEILSECKQAIAEALRERRER
jgi:hypothetical protein